MTESTQKLRPYERHSHLVTKGRNSRTQRIGKFLPLFTEFGRQLCKGEGVGEFRGEGVDKV